jgi:hypothetical protein
MILEEGIPIPELNPPTKQQTLLSMKIGDSFLDKNPKKISARTNWSISAKAVGVKLTTRSVDGGIRVWRVG